MKNAIVDFDLSKYVIKLCVYANKKVQSNIEMTHHEFLEWLFNTYNTTVVSEACGASNCWNQKATEAGHTARLISVGLVSKIRQNQKQTRTMRWRLCKHHCYRTSVLSQTRLSRNNSNNPSCAVKSLL